MISKPIPSFGKVHRYCWPLISRMHTLQLQFKMAKYLWITLCKYHVHKIQQPKRNLVYQKKIWSNKKIFGIPKKNLVDQKNEKLTGQLVYQRDWPKVHGRRFCFFVSLLMFCVKKIPISYKTQKNSEFVGWEIGCWIWWARWKQANVKQNICLMYRSIKWTWVLPYGIMFN